MAQKMLKIKWLKLSTTDEDNYQESKQPIVVEAIKHLYGI